MRSWGSYINDVTWHLIPATRFFALKRRMLQWAGAEIGHNVRLTSSARVALGGRLIIGDNSWIGHQVLFVGGDAEVQIGSDCDVAPRVSFITGTHEIEIEGVKAAGKGYSLPITIGSGCWICASATILGGTVIGDHSIVAAGAVVKGDFPPYSVIVGVPARMLRSLRDSQMPAP